MRTLGHIAMTASAASVFAAIWMSAHWWQFGLTALVLLTVGAAALGTPSERGQETGQERAEGSDGTGGRSGDSGAAQSRSGREYGRSADK